MLKLNCTVCKAGHIVIRDSHMMGPGHLIFCFSADGANGGTLDVGQIKLLVQHLQDWLAQHADGEAKPC